MNPLNISPIGFVESDFKEKFATPRQPGLVPAAKGLLIMAEGFNQPEAFTGLEACSHIWLIFGFNQTAEQGWQPRVRPPRLGGNKKVGLWATRSTFRPNPLGLSLVELVKIDNDKGVVLHLRGLDLIDNTPVYDIKPYLPWAESPTVSKHGLAPNKPTVKAWHFIYSEQAQRFLNNVPRQTGDQALQQLIEQVLSQDPRPAYHQNSQRIYGCCLRQVNVQWQIYKDTIWVLSISPSVETSI